MQRRVDKKNATKCRVENGKERTILKQQIREKHRPKVDGERKNIN